MLNWREDLSQFTTTQTLDPRIGSRTLTSHRVSPVQHDVFQTLVNLVFPRYCCQCGRIGQYLCPTCFEFIHFYSHTVPLRLESVYVDRVVVMGQYAHPLSSLIHTLKYQSVKGIARWCAELLYFHAHIPDCDVIVPVPITRQRWRERGFNQAEEIGKHLGVWLDIPCVNLLVRTKHSAPQVSVNDQVQRKTRLRNHFAVNQKSASVQKTFAKVLLIDDVVTTGSTLNECAKVLKLAGVKEVNALALAHGQ